MAAGNEALVTVVIVAYNGASRLDRCLDAVADQELAQQGRVACWVVDNASADGSADVVRRRTDGARLIASPRNLGFAGGNNLALRQVTSPFVVLLNDDAVPEPGWLTQLLQPFSQERVGAVTGKLLLQPRFLALPVQTRGTDRLGVTVVERDGKDVTAELVWDPVLAGPQDRRAHWCRPHLDLLVPLPLGVVGSLDRPVRVRLHVMSEQPAVVRIAGQEHPVGPAGQVVDVVLPVGTVTVDVVNSAGTVLTVDGYAADRGFGRVDDGSYDAPEEVFGGCGASLALRTAALHEVGLFDDDWFLYYEDVDLCWRLRRGGWTIRYVPAAVARHEHSASVGTGSDLHAFHDARNRLLTLVKNASLPVVVRTVGRYPLTTAAEAVRHLRTGQPERRAVTLRLRVLASFLRLLPRVVGRRRTSQKGATVPRAAVEAWIGRR